MDLQETWPDQEKIRGGFAGALVLHGALVAAVVFSGFVFQHHGNEWGAAMDAHSIQATAVSAIPLPSTQPVNDNVLATETPSPAPVTAPKEEAKPVPDAIPIPVKNLPKPKKEADKTTPPPPKYKQPVQTPTDKAAYGEQAGSRIQVAQVSTADGQIATSVADSDFGSRFPFYINGMNTRIQQNWYKQEIDPATAQGRKVTLHFEIARDGSPSNVKVVKTSGSSTCDQSTMRALQRIDNFAPLPIQYTQSRVIVETDFLCGKQ
jgi:protein TonB